MKTVKANLKQLDGRVQKFGRFRMSAYIRTSGGLIQELQLSYSRDDAAYHIGLIVELGMYDFGEFSFTGSQLNACLDKLLEWRPGAIVFLETLKVFIADNPKSQSFSSQSFEKMIYKITRNALESMFPVDIDESQLIAPPGDERRREVLKASLIKHLLGGPDGLFIWNKVPHYVVSSVSWENTNLQNIDLAGIRISSSFSHCDFNGANLCGANFSSAKLTNSRFVGADMRDIKMEWLNAEDADFSNAILSRAELSHIEISNAKFKSADLSNADLSWAKAEAADFSDADLRNCDFRSSHLQNARFNGSDLTKADFSKADIRGVDLTVCKLDGAIFHDAEYDERTILPFELELQFQLVWKGKNKDAYVLKIEDKVANIVVEDLKDFLRQLRLDFDNKRISNALTMLKQDSFKLLSKQDDHGIFGIIKSQTDDSRVYACGLRNDGAFSCATQKLRPCGGLRGSLCKHLLLLLIGLAKSESIELSHALKLALTSLARTSGKEFSMELLRKREEESKRDKEFATKLLIEYKGGTLEDLDWRPTETIPEDYFAY